MTIMAPLAAHSRSKQISFYRRAPQGQDAFVMNAVALFLLCFVICVLDVGLPHSVPFGVDVGSFLNINAVIVVVFVPIAVCYTFVRFDKSVASMAWSFAVVAVLIPALCLLTYIACALGADVPLRDETLAHFDAALGFSWPSMLAWAGHHPLLSIIGRWAYLSVFPQAAAAILLLSLTQQAERLQAMIYAFVIGAVLCSVVSSVVPALGAYRYFAISLGQHPNLALQVRDLTVATVLDLRSGSFETFSASTSQGIISFPSFHTVLGLLLAWAFWNLAWFRWVGVSLNAALIAATPLQGSHYLADVLAGATIGMIAIAGGVALHAAVAELSRALRRPGRTGLLRFH